MDDNDTETAEACSFQPNKSNLADSNGMKFT